MYAKTYTTWCEIINVNLPVDNGKKSTWNVQFIPFRIRYVPLQKQRKSTEYLKTTLIRHFHGELKAKRPGELSLTTRAPTISSQNEKALDEYIKEMESKLFGLTRTDVRKLAYEFAVRNNITHSFSNDKQMAGTDWLYAFMKRNPDISLRKPEPTSLARAMGFNKPQVKRFYDLLGDIMD